MPDRKDLLLEAGLSLASELSLPRVLQRIVDLAAQLTEARYGALGVLAPGGGITEFITTGVDDDQRAAIGALPRGRGLLGALIEDARPLRLERIADDPRSVGFPPNHPPMATFLGAPVMALGRVYGNIYLTEKSGGRPFTERDQRDLVVLATQAGVAIANASLYADSRRQAQMVEALREITETILERTPTSEVVGLICRRARELAGADLASVVSRTGTAGTLAIIAADGDFQPGFLDLELPEEGSLSGEVMRSGTVRVVEDAGTDQRVFHSMAILGNMGHCAFLPLRVKERAFGTLAIAKAAGGAAFTERQLQLAGTFADQASMAMEYGRIRLESERLGILDDRERIARELHDGIIQSLFAVGMSLQGIAATADGSWIGSRLEGAVDEIDHVIRDLRNYIFGLRPGILADRQLDQALRALADDVGSSAGITVEVEIDPTVAAELSPRANDVLQLSREALSNASRHSGSDHVRLSLLRDAGGAVLTVRDDGRGFDPKAITAGQGLGNLRTRVAALAGSLRIASAPGKGTRVRVRLPLQTRQPG